MQRTLPLGTGDCLWFFFFFFHIVIDSEWHSAPILLSKHVFKSCQQLLPFLFIVNHMFTLNEWTTLCFSYGSWLRFYIKIFWKFDTVYYSITPVQQWCDNSLWRAEGKRVLRLGGSSSCLYDLAWMIQYLLFHSTLLAKKSMKFKGSLSLLMAL